MQLLAYTNALTEVFFGIRTPCSTTPLCLLCSNRRLPCSAALHLGSVEDDFDDAANLSAVELGRMRWGECSWLSVLGTEFGFEGLQWTIIMRGTQKR